ncbi:MAG: GGDEF domain-containing protein, partial [Novosphingobium sp.]|nr:GGDEF domain-containing protein [Novosphingobium sp.]
MTAHDPKFAREPKGFLRWFGFGAAPCDGQEDASGETAVEENTLLHDKRELRRRQVLADLSSFLLTHRLEVSPYTLAIAHDVIVGADQR